MDYKDAVETITKLLENGETIKDIVEAFRGKKYTEDDIRIMCHKAMVANQNFMTNFQNQISQPNNIQNQISQIGNIPPINFGGFGGC